MKNLIQDGLKRLDYTNGTGVAISAGDIVAFGAAKNIAGIATNDIAIAGEGALAFDVIVNVPKVATGEIALGAEMKLGTAANTVQIATAGDTGILRNVTAYATALTGEETIKVIVSAP